jgi:hypothetical protein
MSMISSKTGCVKPTRHSARPSAPFGAGIFPARTRFEPTEDDRQWAAQVFAADADWDVRMAEGDEVEPDWDMLAAEAAYYDTCAVLGPPPLADRCEACGKAVEPGELEMGLCSRCMSSAEEHAIAAQYAALGMGWHTY